jgi:C-terminal processing protease CtpA/Prc
VTLMGQHTHGVLDYSNMRRAESPCKDMGLAFATTKSRRIKMGQAIDNVGIKPQVLLTKDKDWVEAAKKYLER